MSAIDKKRVQFLKELLEMGVERYTCDEFTVHFGSKDAKVPGIMPLGAPKMPAEHEMSDDDYYENVVMHSSQ